MQWGARRGCVPHPYLSIFLWLLRRPILRSSLRSSSAFTKWPFVTDEGSSWRSYARYRTGRNERGESIHCRIRRWALLETEHMSCNSGLTTLISIFYEVFCRLKCQCNVVARCKVLEEFCASNFTVRHWLLLGFSLTFRMAFSCMANNK